VANHGNACLMDTATTDIDNFTFIDATGTTYSDPYTVNEGVAIITGDGNTNSRVRNCHIVATANFTLKWNNWAGGGGGFPRTGQTDGRFDNGKNESFQELRFQRDANFGGGFNQWSSLSFRSAAPAVGTYQPGTLVVNCAPAVGGIASWQQTAGAFQPVGIVGAVQAATQANSVAATVAALVTDFNALLAKLRTAKLMA
jgi:hypothetical protein